jgi:ParB/RepB/Spo0J family partition protein
MKRKPKEIPLDSIILDGVWPEDKALTASIAEVGLLHPIHVYPSSYANGKYMLMAGRSRVASTRTLEWEKIEAFVYQDVMEALRCQVALGENVRRKNPLSDARAIAQMTEEEALKIGGVNKTQYKAAMCLLDLLPELLAKLEVSNLPVTAARKLCKLSEDDQRRAIELAEQANREGRNRAKGPTVAQWFEAVREVKYEKQAALPAFEFSVDAATAKSSGPNYMAIMASLYRLTDECPHEILQPMLDWLGEQ